MSRKDQLYGDIYHRDASAVYDWRGGREGPYLGLGPTGWTCYSASALGNSSEKTAGFRMRNKVALTNSPACQ